MRNTLFIFIFMISASLVQFLPGDNISYAEKRFVIKFATVAPEGSTWIKHMRTLDKRLREKSDDRISFRIYAGGIAGDELDVLKKIRIGQIHCAAFSGAGISQILPMARVLDLPFLFRNNEEVAVVQKELRDFFSEQFQKAGFKFLAWAEVGDVHLFSKKPINKKGDLSGLKIWTWYGDPISKKTFTAMGTSPIPLAITDVTTALNTNMIDTVYAPPIGALALQWHSYLKYMMSLPLAHSTGVVVISEDYFNKIPDDLANLIKEEIECSMAELSMELKKQAEEAIEFIRKSGVTLAPMPSESEMRDFYGVHDDVAQELTGVVYPKDLLDRVYDILGTIRNTQ
ncbi:TRAP transporter substrate-binding protein DctP [Deltaproteobacteria bacterium]|nr:TRAP transporter substrate-binding protein DctP [Deltaproteobacteria bacterium]